MAIINIKEAKSTSWNRSFCISFMMDIISIGLDNDDNTLLCVKKMSRKESIFRRIIPSSLFRYHYCNRKCKIYFIIV